MSKTLIFGEKSNSISNSYLKDSSRKEYSGYNEALNRRISGNTVRSEQNEYTNTVGTRALKANVFNYGKESFNNSNDKGVSLQFKTFNSPTNKIQKDQYINIYDEKTNKNTKYPLSNEMEIIYKNMEEDDEIPDESPNAEELIKIHDQLIPRGSITNNILSHSFVLDTPMSMLSSINDSRRESEQYYNRNNLYKENSMSVQNNDVYNSIEFMSPQSNFSGSDKISDLKAVLNWERLFKR